MVKKNDPVQKKLLFEEVKKRINEYLEGKKGIKEDGETLCPMDSDQPPKVTTEETQNEEEPKRRPKRMARQTQNDNEAAQKRKSKGPPHFFHIDKLKSIAKAQKWGDSTVLCGFVEHFLWKQKLTEIQIKSQTTRKKKSIQREQAATVKKSKME